MDTIVYKYKKLSNEFINIDDLNELNEYIEKDSFIDGIICYGKHCNEILKLKLETFHYLIEPELKEGDLDDCYDAVIFSNKDEKIYKPFLTHNIQLKKYKDDKDIVETICRYTIRWFIDGLTTE